MGTLKKMPRKIQDWEDIHDFYMRSESPEVAKHLRERVEML